MPDLDIYAIRTALAQRLAAIDGLLVYSHHQDQPTIGPRGTVIIEEPDDQEMVVYHDTGDGDTLLSLGIRVLVGATVNEQAHYLLDEYRGRNGEYSLIDYLEGDPGISGTAYYVLVQSAGPLSVFFYGDARYWGVEFRAEVRC